MRIYTIEKSNMYLMDVCITDWTNEWNNVLIFASRDRAEREFNMIADDEVGDAKIVEYETICIKSIKVEDKWCVYVMSEEDGHFKIGYAKDPIKRKKDLQTGNSKKITLEGWFVRNSEKEMRHLERTLHNSFAEYRLNGEWFKDPDNLIKTMVLDSHKNDKTFERYIG